MSEGPICSGMGCIVGFVERLKKLLLSESKVQKALLREVQERSGLEKLLCSRNSELSKSYKFLNSLIENLPNMVFVKDAKDLRFVSLNKAGERLLGYPSSSFIGKSDYDFFTKEQADIFTRNDRSVLSGSEIVEFPEEQISTRYLGQRTLSTKKIPIFGADGKPEYLLGISEDVTDKKNADAQRERLIHERVGRIESDRATARFRFLSEASRQLASSLHYRETLKCLADLVLPSHADMCTITMLNEERQEFEPLTAGHVDPQKRVFIQELADSYPLRAEGPDLMARVLGAGESILISEVDQGFLNKAAQGPRFFELMRELKPTSVMIIPIRVREKVIGSLSMAYSEGSRVYRTGDLSLAEELGRRAGMAVENARLYEQAQRAIELRNEFLSIASHELKTPLTSLKLQTQLARRSIDLVENKVPSPQKLAKIFEISEKQIDRLTALIEDLLDVSRIDAGKLAYSFKNEDLAKIVRDVVSGYADQLAAAGCQFALELEEPSLILCDSFRMEQVLVNLLSNAVKYAPGKPIRVAVRLCEGRVRLEVQDQGAGISQVDQVKIFDRFERFVSNRNISGLGLGLYISQQIVHGHHGQIHVESVPGGGATFVADFPSVSANI